MATLDTDKKKVLGRGLASLIPDAGTLGGAAVKKDFFQCDIEKIVPNTYQPRKIFEKEALDDLIQSIKMHGIIQPLVVRRNHGHYELVAGERRWRAAQRAGLKQVPVVVREVTGDQQALEMALIENIQRANLNCIEEAIAYQQLVDEFKLSQEDISESVGKSRATVANTLRLLKLPQAIREDITSGKLSMGHARALLSLDETSQQLQARDQIVQKNLSVRETEKLVNTLLKKTPKLAEKTVENAANPSKNPNIQALEERLQRHYGTKVQILGSDEKGTVQFDYVSQEDLTRISEALLWSFDKN